MIVQSLIVYSIRWRGVRLEPATTRTHCECLWRTSKNVAIQLGLREASARVDRDTRALALLLMAAG
jgi:hypothetical protein